MTPTSGIGCRIVASAGGSSRSIREPLAACLRQGGTSARAPRSERSVPCAGCSRPRPEGEGRFEIRSGFPLSSAVPPGKRMTELIHDLLLSSAQRNPRREALVYQGARLDYDGLAAQVRDCAAALSNLGLGRSERVAVYLEKRIETVVAVFGAAAAGGVFVPINPLLKPDQVAYILKDCNVRILVTSIERLRLLAAILHDCHDLHAVIVVGGRAEPTGNLELVAWEDALSRSGKAPPHRVIDSDMAAILYTSGST